MEPREKKESKQGNTNLFIDKLFSMLNDSEQNEVLSWDPDGKSFTIHDPQTFTTGVLPQHFKHNNLFSFIR